MTNLTPEQLAEIRARHETVEADESMYNYGRNALSHKDRAALLQHIDAQQARLDRLREENERLRERCSVLFDMQDDGNRDWRERAEARIAEYMKD